MLMQPYYFAKQSNIQVTPVLKANGIVAGTGTSWTGPSCNVGDLIVAARLSTSGSVPGMGTGMTFLGDSSGFTASYDYSFSYALSANNGTTVFTIPSGGSTIVYTVWAANTFLVSDPVEWGSDAAQIGNSNTSWNAFNMNTFDVGVYGSYSGVNIRVGEIVPSVLIHTANAAAPYVIQYSKTGGWANTANITHTSTGSAGQVATKWNYKIKGIS